MSLTVEVAGEGGNDAEIRTLQSRAFALVVDGDTLRPALCSEIEVESNSDTQTTGDQCGNRTQEHVAQEPFRVTINGVVTKQDQPDVLTLYDLLHRVQEGDEVRMVSDFPIERAMTVRNVITRQSSDLVHIEIPSTEDERFTTEGKQLAFEFQLVLGAEEN